MGRLAQLRESVRHAYALTRDVLRAAQARAQEGEGGSPRAAVPAGPAGRKESADQGGEPEPDPGEGGGSGPSREDPPPTDPPHRHDHADNAVPRSLKVAAAWSWRLIVVGAVAYALLWLAQRYMLLVAPLMIALLLAGLLMPAQRALLKAGINRSVGALTVMVAGIAAVGGTLYLVVLQFVNGFDDLVDNVEQGIDQVEEWLRGSALDPGNLGPDPDQSPPPSSPDPSPPASPDPSPTASPAPEPTAGATAGPTPSPTETTTPGGGGDDGSRLLENLQDAFQDWVERNQDQITTFGVATLAGTVQFLTGMVLTLVITYFFLRDGRGIWTFLVGLLPVPARAPMAYAGDGAWRSLSGYVRATVLVALVDAIGIGIGLLILSLVMNFPRGLVVPLAALVFLGAFVPIVGAFVSGSVAVIVGLVTGLENGPAYGLLQALIVLGIVLLIQQLEGNVLQPFIVSKMVRIHPLAVIITVMAGILLAGIIGALVAVPIVAVLNTVVRRLSRYRQLPPELTPVAASPGPPPS